VTTFALAGYMVFLAMVADVLDGRVARLTRTTSSFGGQLDSLSDAISFGVAPAFLMMKVVEFHLNHLALEFSKVSIIIGRGILFSAIFYAMCAVVRLARFNVENEEDESAHMNFAGLPSPAAAGVVVSLVILQQQFLPRISGEVSKMFHSFEILTVSGLPVITLLAGILMVSRIRYPHLANQLFRSKRTLSTLLAFFASGILIIWNLHLALVIGFCGFALFGFCRWAFVRVFRKRTVNT
jgi:CDP-diacylglycerol--serine O-phosphatidyltransferase